MSIISLRDIRKTYGKGASAYEALHGVSIDIEKGESVAILGKSGSGKSTLMHVMAMLDTPTSGTQLYDGTDIRSMSPKMLNIIRNKKFAFIFQQFFMNPKDNVLHNVTLPLKIGGVPRKERERRAMEALESVGLSKKAKNKATDLSGGEKQRVCIARAMVSEPEVLFADEPTGNLDSGTGEIVEKLLFDMNKKNGVTLILVTHDMELGERCGRRARVKDGMLI